jgi:hypothetical protein
MSKTLKNDHDRKLFIDNPGNWEIIRDHGLIRILQLNKTRIAKVQIKTADSERLHVGYQDIAYREIIGINGDEIMISPFPLEERGIILYLKHIKF